MSSSDDVEELFKRGRDEFNRIYVDKMSSSSPYLPDGAKLTEAERKRFERDRRRWNRWYRRLWRWVRNLRVVDIRSYRHEDTL